MLPDQPSYLDKDLSWWDALEEWMEGQLRHCRLCPRNCQVNRYEVRGACGQTHLPRLSNAVVHTGEEPPLIEGSGAGAIFFSGCSMQCMYCQNFGFSQTHIGRDLTTGKLSEEFLRLQSLGVSNLDLVTPAPHLPGVVSAIRSGIEQGLRLPVVYNTSSYDSVESLRRLEGLVDIYLADIRYTSDDVGLTYSGVKDYWSCCQRALREMYRQVGSRGMIIRMLVLPSYVEMIREGLEFVAFDLSASVSISLMSQYFPVYKALGNERIGRKLTLEEYEQAQGYLEEMGFSNGWVQAF